jgi:hypothetical protein
VLEILQAGLMMQVLGMCPQLGTLEVMGSWQQGQVRQLERERDQRLLVTLAHCPHQQVKVKVKVRVKVKVKVKVKWHRFLKDKHSKDKRTIQ